MSVTPIGCCTQIRLPEAVIPGETLHRLVAADLHDCEGVNPCPSHVRDRRMTEVMKVEAHDSGQLAGCRKRAFLKFATDRPSLRKTCFTCSALLFRNSEKVALSSGESGTIRPSSVFVSS